MTDEKQKEIPPSIKDLLAEYRGLKAEDLNEINPTYSCVICKDTKCEFHNIPNKACPRCDRATETEWINFYDFRV